MSLIIRKRNSSCAAVMAIVAGGLFGTGVMPGCALSDYITVAGPAGNGGSADPAPARVARPRFVVNQPLSKAVLPLVSEVGAEEGKLIYQVHADPNETGTLDLQRLRKRIEQYVPANYTGFVCLDFEDPYNDWLWRKPNDPRYLQSQEQLVGAVRMAKSMRPNAKWTVWSQPLIRLERGMYSPPAELLAELDWLSPAIYDKYPDDEQPGIEEQRAFVTEAIRQSRQLAGDRPVLAYIWHRRGPRTNKLKYQPPHLSLLPDEEILRYVDWAMEAGADGIVWWGGDTFEAGLLENPPGPGDKNRPRYLRLKAVYSQEKPPGMSYEAYLDTLHRRMLRLIGGELSRDSK